MNFLFVGRIAPNKKIEDHIRLAEHYKRYVDAYYRFIFVGRFDVVPRYYSMIRALMAEYRLLHDRFIFTGPVPDEELAVYYQHAAVYISLSEHEGFCVPLVEAMAADVPVLAYAAAAVPDTLGGAGVQFAPKDLEFAAELLGELAFDDGLRGVGHRRPAPAPGRLRRRARLARAHVDHPSSLVKIAFIIQRYGAEVLGGSEQLCRLLAERLAAQHDVEVLTTCARDYVTWKNEYPEGVGSHPRRHGPALRQRAHARHRRVQQLSEWIYNNPHTRADELEWLKQQGPWCPALIEHLQRHQRPVRRPGLLHVSVRADRARPRGRALAERPRVDGPRRAGDPARHLQGRLQQAGGALLPHRERTTVRAGRVPRSARCSKR